MAIAMLMIIWLGSLSALVFALGYMGPALTRGGRSPSKLDFEAEMPQRSRRR